MSGRRPTTRLFRRTLPPRPRFSGALATILVIGTAITGLGAVETGAWRDVLINVGASGITVLLAALALEPLVEQGRRPEEAIPPGVPHQRFLDGLESRCRRVTSARHGADRAGVAATPHVHGLGGCRRALVAAVAPRPEGATAPSGVRGHRGQPDDNAGRTPEG